MTDDIEDAITIPDQRDMAPDLDEENAELSTIRVANSFVAVDSGSGGGVASYIVHDDRLGETASLPSIPRIAVTVSASVYRSLGWRRCTHAGSRR